MVERRVGRFEITPDLLFQYWPKEMRVIAARVGFQGNLEILIEHSDLKPTLLFEGESAPHILPSFKQGAPAVDILANAPVSATDTTIHEPCVILTLAERRRIVEAIRKDVPVFNSWGQD